MPTECNATLFEFEAVERRAVVAGFDGGDITSNAGALLLGQVDRGLGLIRRFGECFTDRRDPRYVEHRIETLVGQRIFGLVLGYEDLNDHDELRKDPTFGVLAGKLHPVLRSDCDALAGKSTLNRLEHTPRRHAAKYHKIDCDGSRVDELLVELFLEAHDRAPREIVLDLDNTDIPLHGGQEGRFFHGYYDEFCYLPLYVFCGRHLLLARQRRANVAGSDGAVEEMARIIARIRRKWRWVRIILRGDSGFANDPLMRWCEANRVDYVFGLARNSRLEAALGNQAAEAKVRRIHFAIASGCPNKAEFNWLTSIYSVPSAPPDGHHAEMPRIDPSSHDTRRHTHALSEERRHQTRRARTRCQPKGCAPVERPQQRKSRRQHAAQRTEASKVREIQARGAGAARRFGASAGTLRFGGYVPHLVGSRRHRSGTASTPIPTTIIVIRRAALWVRVSSSNTTLRGCCGGCAFWRTRSDGDTSEAECVPNGCLKHVGSSALGFQVVGCCCPSRFR